MRIFAIFIITILIGSIIITPFFFGKDKGIYNAKEWLLEVLKELLIIYLLYNAYLI